MRKWMALGMVLPGMMTAAHAWTFDGYMAAGGAGQLRCTDFQNALGEARALGLNSRNGIERMNPFIQYAFGYYTRYNEQSEGIYDLLDGVRGNNMVVSVLTILDNWCSDNPLSDFDEALSASIGTLLPTARLER
jgi:hypothetical protein